MRTESLPSAPGLVMQYVTTFDFIGYLVLFNRDIEYLSVVNGAFRKGAPLFPADRNYA